jgi:serine/threonine protein kinase
MAPSNTENPNPIAATTATATTATVTPTPSSASCKRKLFWHQSIVKRTVSFVESDMESVVRRAPFLQQVEPDHANIALFSRCEIETGCLLGTGGFSVVMEVTGFTLDPTISARLTPAQNELRERYVRDCLDPNTGRGMFAVKHLQERLLKSQKDFQFAASDLVVEGAYLSLLNHPNIVTCRGLPVDGVHALQDGKHDGYFILSDRLEDTLAKRIQEWKKATSVTSTNSTSTSTTSTSSAQPSVHTKTLYALQIANALEYLHSHGIMFRDLKPHNIGFSTKKSTEGGSSVTEVDQVQLLDFGLVRELPEQHASESDVFEMSGVGTRRYMAVEVILPSARYNCKADVYSWSMVFWEMLSLHKPYATYSVEEHNENVCLAGERPALNSQEWPVSVQYLLQQAWVTSVDERFTMRQVKNALCMIVESNTRDNINMNMNNNSVKNNINIKNKMIFIKAPDSPVSVAMPTNNRYEDDINKGSCNISNVSLTKSRVASRSAPHVYLQLKPVVEDEEHPIIKYSPTHSMSESSRSCSDDGMASLSVMGDSSLLEVTWTSLEGIEVVVDRALEERIVEPL